MRRTQRRTRRHAGPSSLPRMRSARAVWYPRPLSRRSPPVAPTFEYSLWEALRTLIREVVAVLLALPQAVCVAWAWEGARGGRFCAVACAGRQGQILAHMNDMMGRPRTDCGDGGWRWSVPGGPRLPGAGDPARPAGAASAERTSRPAGSHAGTPAADSVEGAEHTAAAQPVAARPTAGPEPVLCWCTHACVVGAGANVFDASLPFYRSLPCV